LRSLGFVLIDNRPRTNEISLLGDPHFGISFRHGQLAGAALGILVEDVGFDSGMIEEIPEEMSLRQVASTVKPTHRANSEQIHLSANRWRTKAPRVERQAFSIQTQSLASVVESLL
jgi:hypothetical protein